jgi:hypothetical protein
MAIVTRPMTARERATLQATFPWADAASGLAGVAVAVVVSGAVVGLPLWLLLWAVGVSNASEWVKLLLWLVAAMFLLPFALSVVSAYTAEVRGLRRARDLDVVEDRVVHIDGCVDVDFESRGVRGWYLRETNGDVTLLMGDYLVPLRRAGIFPSTVLRLIRVPDPSRVVGLMPLGDPLASIAIPGTEGLEPAGGNGEQVTVDFDQLVAIAARQYRE